MATQQTSVIELYKLLDFWVTICPPSQWRLNVHLKVIVNDLLYSRKFLYVLLVSTYFEKKIKFSYVFIVSLFICQQVKLPRLIYKDLLTLSDERSSVRSSRVQCSASSLTAPLPTFPQLQRLVLRLSMNVRPFSALKSPNDLLTTYDLKMTRHQ